MNNIRQNLFFAFVYNLVGVPIAAGVLFPFFGFASIADDRKCGDDFQFGFGYFECIAVEKFEIVIKIGKKTFCSKEFKPQTRKFNLKNVI